MGFTGEGKCFGVPPACSNVLFCTCFVAAALLRLHPSEANESITLCSYAQHAPRLLRKSLEDSVQWLAQSKVRVPVSHRCGACCLVWCPRRCFSADVRKHCSPAQSLQMPICEILTIASQPCSLQLVACLC